MKKFFVGCKKVLKGGLVSLAASSPVFATGTFDTTSVVAVIGEATAAIGLVAAAVFAGPIIVAKAWKWLRRGT